MCVRCSSRYAKSIQRGLEWHMCDCVAASSDDARAGVPRNALEYREHIGLFDCPAMRHKDDHVRLSKGEEHRRRA